MPIADIVIAVAIVISIVVGIFRGFVKEALSIVSLLVAAWAAMNFGEHAAALGENWIDSEGLQLWFGRILLFVVILAVGGLLGWGISRLVRLSILSGADRALGALFGFCRAAVLLGVFVIGGQLASFDQDGWWQSSRLIPYGVVVADWIRVMAPKGVDLLHPDEQPAAEPQSETL
jgi:membrane protein required for colicin V production